jgi:hypothetical protein
MYYMYHPPTTKITFSTNALRQLDNFNTSVSLFIFLVMECGHPKGHISTLGTEHKAIHTQRKKKTKQKKTLTIVLAEVD